MEFVDSESSSSVSRSRGYRLLSAPTTLAEVQTCTAGAIQETLTGKQMTCTPLRCNIMYQKSIPATIVEDTASRIVVTMPAIKIEDTANRTVVTMPAIKIEDTAKPLTESTIVATGSATLHMDIPSSIPFLDEEPKQEEILPISEIKEEIEEKVVESMEQEIEDEEDIVFEEPKQIKQEKGSTLGNIAYNEKKKTKQETGKILGNTMVQEKKLAKKRLSENLVPVTADRKSRLDIFGIVFSVILLSSILYRKGRMN